MGWDSFRVLFWFAPKVYQKVSPSLIHYSRSSIVLHQKIGKYKMRLKSILMPRMFVIVILAAIYSLGFIVTPYWMNVQSKTEMIFILVLTIGIGVIWSFLSAGDLQIRVIPINWSHFFILLAGLLVLNLRPLTSDIPWRGDEDYHIARTLSLASRIATKWVIAFFIVFISSAYIAWKKSKWSIFPGILFVAGLIFFSITKNPLAEIAPTTLRYPYISYWFVAVIPKLAMLIKVNPYQEVLFRIVPFLSTFALVWVFQNELAKSKTALVLLWGLAVATIPIVYYYSSILYLELPAVCLMLIICLNLKSLLKDDWKEIKQSPAWYALILIGFIKETTVPFLICFLAWRLITSLFQRKIFPTTLKLSLHNLGDQIRISLAVLFPAFFYLFLRSTLSQQNRGFSLTFSNLTNIIVYRTIIQSFLEQFGPPLLLLFFGGCVMLFWRKEYFLAGFFLSLVFLYPLFYAVDVLSYAGYSRFNLFVLPPILAGSSILIKQIMNYRKILAIATACVILAINLWTSPVFIDGTKTPLWGNYLTDTSEHYYPYREALVWLQNNYENERIMFTGMYYDYIFEFYFAQLNWYPTSRLLLTNNGDNDAVSLSLGLAEAENAKINIVLFQVLGNEIPKVKDIGCYFYEERIFRNDAHTLVVYHRKP